MLVQVEEVQKSVVKIILNRPEKRNALSIALLKELRKALEDTLGKNRVVILAGRGSVFCAGLDLVEAREVPFQEHLGATLKECLILLTQAPSITIAAVQGAAIAGGGGLAAACDLCVAEESAVFGFPEARRGLVPSLIMPILMRKLRQADLNELIYLCENISAKKALEIGLINGVGSLEQMLQERIKQALLSAPGAIAETKKLIAQYDGLKDKIEKAYHSHCSMREADEAIEGVKAFMENRAPSWT